MSRCALLFLVVSGCAAPAELRRTLIDRPVDQRGCTPTVAVELEPSWPTTTLHVYRADRCIKVTTEEWEVVRGRQGNAALFAGIGGAVVSGSAYAVLSRVAPPAGPGGASVGGTLTAVGLCLGTAALGSLLGTGLLKLYEKSTETREVRTEPGKVEFIELNRRPLDGLLSLGPYRWTTRQARVELDAATVVAFDLSGLELDGVVMPVDSVQRALAMVCARTQLSLGVDVSLLDEGALDAAFRDAQACFDGGVTACDPALTRIFRERLKRLHSRGDAPTR